MPRGDAPSGEDPQGRRHTHMLFTVFTPTFNRAHTLVRVYKCLLAQTVHDFEWLIVDDGSTDGTEALVEVWRDEAPFDIRYLYQENGGKHRAQNAAIQLARGELFLTIDSDDACVPTALERLWIHWDSIPNAERERFSGVTVLCADEGGAVVGMPFPCPVIDSDPLEMLFRYRITGEKWGFHRTEVLRRFPFPEFTDEKFIAEGVVWNRIGRKYKLRCVNEPLRVFHRSPGGLSDSSRYLRVRNCLGARLYYKEILSDEDAPLAIRARHFINYSRFSFHAGMSIGRMLRESRRYALAPLLLIGWGVYLLDTIRSGSTKGPAGLAS